MIFFKLSFPCHPRTNGKVLGTTRCCQSHTALPPVGDLNLSPGEITHPKARAAHVTARQKCVQSLVVLLRPIESDYCRVAKGAPPTPPPRKLRLPENEANFRNFLVIAESNSHF